METLPSRPLIYICSTLRGVLFDYGFKVMENNTITALLYFPELLKYKPLDTPTYSGVFGWFGNPLKLENKQRRIKVLQELIKEIESQ
ncbi:MAG: hypothetical protein LBU42_00760 [Prevotellaceae bacterium]|nr:hypothetical protein [Prevotellaceae bacterium]